MPRLAHHGRNPEVDHGISADAGIACFSRAQFLCWSGQESDFRLVQHRYDGWQQVINGMHVAASTTPLQPTLACAAGKSRLELIHTDSMEKSCRPPQHNKLQAAVLDCFSTSRATVVDCKLRLRPHFDSLRDRFSCRPFSAEGTLQGDL